MAEEVIIGNAELWHGDCREVLPLLRFDSLVSDPPYGQTNEDYDGSGAASLSADIWRMAYDVANESACVVSFAGSPTYHKIATAIEQGGWKVRQMWGWTYADGLITSAYPKEGFDRLAPAIDPIVFATRGKVLLPLQRQGNDVWRRPNKSRGEMNYSARTSGHGAEEQRGQWPRSVFYQARSSAGTGDIGHPNAKPERLMTWLVSHTPGIVLDPFMGSGSTGVACTNLGRRFIGIELKRKYFEIACERIARAQAQGRMEFKESAPKPEQGDLPLSA